MRILLFFHADKCHEKETHIQISSICQLWKNLSFHFLTLQLTHRRMYPTRERAKNLHRRMFAHEEKKTGSSRHLDNLF